MADVSIEIAGADDAAGVTSLLEASYGDLMRGAYPPEVLARALPHMTVANPILLTSGRFFVACTPERQIVACGGWSTEVPGVRIEPGLGHLRHFATHPAWTRRGLGTRIFAACLAQADKAGIVAFDVCSALNAVDFYAALGFGEPRDLPVDLGDGVVLRSVLLRRGKPHL